MKYMGSKASIAKYILPYIQHYMFINNLSTYIEPFVGGANVIDKVDATYKMAYDKNKYLIALFNHLQNGGRLPDYVTRQEYSDCRLRYRIGDTQYPEWYIGAVGFLAGFNGRFFDGGYGGTSTDKETGKVRDYYLESRENILNQVPNLGGIQFGVADYSSLNPSNALIYCDPPYENTKEYATSSDFDHKKFWDKMREWSKNNIILISEEHAPDDFDCIWEQEVNRTIQATNKKKSTEKLFIHMSQNIDRNVDPINF